MLRPGRREYQRKWAARNAAKYRANARAYRLAHPDYERQWSKANPGKCRARERKYDLAHPEKSRDAARRRRVRALSAPGIITREEWAARLEEFGGRCGYCGHVKKLAMDHVDPLSKGGAHEIENAVPACKSCNSSKHDKPLIVWLAERAA
jgi:5-methylcytosine-specific restriction endonuclease McrA